MRADVQVSWAVQSTECCGDEAAPADPTKNLTRISTVPLPAQEAGMPGTSLAAWQGAVAASTDQPRRHQ